MAASRPVEWRHFDVILLKSTATFWAVAKFVGDRTTASTSLAGAASVGDLSGEDALQLSDLRAQMRMRAYPL